MLVWDLWNWACRSSCLHVLWWSKWTKLLLTVTLIEPSWARHHQTSLTDESFAFSLPTSWARRLDDTCIITPRLMSSPLLCSLWAAWLFFFFFILIVMWHKIHRSTKLHQRYHLLGAAMLLWMSVSSEVALHPDVQMILWSTGEGEDVHLHAHQK